MAQIKIDGERLIVRITGIDLFLRPLHDVEVPLKHIQGAVARSPEMPSWFGGLRMPGINVPGVVTAGTFVTAEGWVFYDVHNPDKTITIDLSDEKYRKLIVQVDDESPEEAVARIQAAIAVSDKG